LKKAQNFVKLELKLELRKQNLEELEKGICFRVAHGQ
jgi:hypothetical protein